MNLAEAPAPLAEVDERRWIILAVIGLAQLMVVLDATIVNVALPSTQRALGFSTADRQWVVTGYGLAFGGLLLVGGRLSDIFGRKRTFVLGLAGFAAGSAFGGAAQSFATLIAARVTHGAFGALLAPSALALLVTTFTDPRERGKALGIFTALAGAGGAIGLMLGGLLTEYLSWHRCLYVNVAFAAVALVGALLFLTNKRVSTPMTLDVPGHICGRRPRSDRLRARERLNPRLEGLAHRPAARNRGNPARPISGAFLWAVLGSNQ